LWIAWILVIGFLLLRPGWIGMLALLSIPLCLQARGRTRWPLLTVWIVMILLTFPKWTPLRQAIPPIDPSSETTLLVRAAELPSNPETCAEFRRRLAVARDPARQSRLKLALAIQTARGGEYSESNALFKEILKDHPDHIAARVGLANNIYYAGRFDVALSEYEIASGLAPEQGEIPYNMAQAYFKKLFLPEGGDALKLARSLGFDPPAWEDTDGRANGFSPVVYIGFTHAEMEASAAWEAELYQPMIHLVGWRHWLGSPPVPLFAVLLVSLVLALGLVYGWSNQRDPRNCQNCGWIICQACCSIHEDTWLCHKCGETATRSKSEMVMATLLKNRSRNQGLARVQRWSLWSRLVPGVGHLAIGSLFACLIRIVLLTTGLFLALFGWIFNLSDHWVVPGLILAEETCHALWWPFPSAAWPGFTGSTVMVGLFLVVLVYILALFDSSHIRQQLPKQLHATTQEVERMPRAAARKMA
jgi:hypothetical protein